jgi:TPR repeat protein
MYYHGQGVSQNYVLAYMWLDLAARQGNKNAKVSRGNVAKKMSHVQIAEAKRLTRQWKTGE